MAQTFNSSQQFKRKVSPKNLSAHETLDEFTQSSLDKYSFVEVDPQMLDAAGIYSKHIVSNKPAIPDLVIYNKKFNKNECFVEANTKDYNPFPRIRFILKARPPANFSFSNSYKKDQENIRNSNHLENIKPEKLDFDKKLMNPDLEIVLDKIQETNTLEDKIENLNIDTQRSNNYLSLYQETDINNEIDHLISEDSNIEKDLEKELSDFKRNPSEGSLLQQQSFGGFGSANLNKVKNYINSNIFLENNEDDKSKNEGDEEGIPSLFADLSLFGKTISSPNQNENYLENREDFKNNYSFNLINNFSNRENPINDLKLVSSASEKPYDQRPYPQHINKKTTNKFSLLTNNLQSKLNISEINTADTNHNFHKQSITPPSNLGFSSNLKNEVLNYNEFTNNHEAPHHSIFNDNQGNGLYEVPLKLIIKNLNYRGWIVTKPEINQSKYFNSNELFIYLNNEHKEGNQLIFIDVRDSDTDSHFLPNYIFECLKIHLPKLLENLKPNSQNEDFGLNRNFNHFNNYNIVNNRNLFNNQNNFIQKNIPQYQNTYTDNVNNLKLKQALSHENFSNQGVFEFNKFSNQTNLNLNSLISPNKLRPQITYNEDQFNNQNALNQNFQQNIFPNNFPIMSQGSLTPNNSSNSMKGCFINPNNNMNNGILFSKINHYNNPPVKNSTLFNNKYNITENERINRTPNRQNTNPPSNVNVEKIINNSSGKIPLNFNSNLSLVKNELNLNHIYFNENSDDQFNSNKGNVLPLFSPENKNVPFGQTNIGNKQRQFEKSSPLKTVKNKYSMIEKNNPILNLHNNKSDKK